MDEFKIIPDAPNYEINREGVVRNRKTGRILKPGIKRQVCFSIDGVKRIYRMPKLLASQIFKLPALKRKKAPVPVTLSKDDRKFSFKNILSAAK